LHKEYPMPEIAGVRFRQRGKIYDFDSTAHPVKVGVHVVVDTIHGLELGEVAAVRAVEALPACESPIKPVLRLATPDDITRAAEIEDKEGDALAECGRLVTRLALPMKLLAAEYNLDGSHLTVFFSSEGRVDFRELVRDLSHTLHVRVELRQIGPRDETKLLGGYGRCGRCLCCASFLSEFSPVSIKMAKTQDLPLNPMKISGVCGRLLCCLGYECEQYRQIKEKMPREGQRVSTDSGIGIVVGSNTLAEQVIVQFETGARIEVPLGKIRLLENLPPPPPAPRLPVQQPPPAQGRQPQAQQPQHTSPSQSQAQPSPSPSPSPKQTGQPAPQSPPAQPLELAPPPSVPELPGLPPE
jgi:cell fate regulator YaaT (PSP1 superfamily)